MNIVTRVDDCHKTPGSLPNVNKERSVQQPQGVSRTGKGPGREERFG
jgi:hypothetical protein